MKAVIISLLMLSVSSLGYAAPASKGHHAHKATSSHTTTVKTVKRIKTYRTHESVSPRHQHRAHAPRQQQVRHHYYHGQRRAQAAPSPRTYRRVYTQRRVYRGNPYMSAPRYSSSCPCHNTMSTALMLSFLI